MTLDEGPPVVILVWGAKKVGHYFYELYRAASAT